MWLASNNACPKPLVKTPGPPLASAIPLTQTPCVVADNLYRLEALLKPLSDARRAELGWNGSEGSGDLLLVRRYIGPEICCCGAGATARSSPTETASRRGLGADRLVLAQRNDVDGAGDAGFDVLVGCLTGELMHDPDVRCTVHGPHGYDQDDDLEGRTDLEAEYAEAVRG
ncbi:hypothetical protein [Streptomyces subrutilus]|uniref:Uncharacterized protein n=1 Tax=Streptomyces subrutilus TaxID=36818 RepID=A0A1E5P0G5_9ACTN|nr:hypothetical protein BGK67_34040 [Streptomyces subrutilus]